MSHLNYRVVKKRNKESSNDVVYRKLWLSFIKKLAILKMSEPSIVIKRMSMRENNGEKKIYLLARW